MGVIDGMTPDQLRAMADELEGDEKRPGYMRRVEVDGIALDVDMRVLKDVRTMRMLAEIRRCPEEESAFAILELFDRILGDQRAEVERALADADGFCESDRYLVFCNRVFEAVGAKN